MYFAFLDLEKAYDRVDRDAMWNVLRLYGIGGRLLRGVRSLYVASKACDRNRNMFFGPKAQRWDQQGHSAPKERKKKTGKTEQEKKHPTKLVKAATCCLLSPLTTTTGWILRGSLC